MQCQYPNGSTPLLSDNTERFWTEDASTGVRYQINSESALTWHQARKSCQEQNAELLSITEIHEQEYVGGKRVENKTIRCAGELCSSRALEDSVGCLVSWLSEDQWFSRSHRDDALSSNSISWCFFGTGPEPAQGGKWSHPTVVLQIGAAMSAACFSWKIPSTFLT